MPVDAGHRRRARGPQPVKVSGRLDSQRLRSHGCLLARRLRVRLHARLECRHEKRALLGRRTRDEAARLDLLCDPKRHPLLARVAVQARRCRPSDQAGASAARAACVAAVDRVGVDQLRDGVRRTGRTRLRAAGDHEPQVLEALVALALLLLEVLLALRLLVLEALVALALLLLEVLLALRLLDRLRRDRAPTVKGGRFGAHVGDVDRRPRGRRHQQKTEDRACSQTQISAGAHTVCTDLKDHSASRTEIAAGTHMC